MEWTVETLNRTVDEELNALPADMRARFTRVVRLIESVGVDRVGQPHVTHLQGRLWEMRLRGRDGIARALYVTVTGQRVVVVRVGSVPNLLKLLSEFAIFTPLEIGALNGIFVVLFL